MSEYSNLKATINANIKANNNQEITGSVMNSVLNAMVNTLGAGYQFAGVATTATNPGTPDAKMFYIANGKGTYTNFGSLEVTEDEVVVLYWDTAWHKEATGIASQEKLTELEDEVVANFKSLKLELLLNKYWSQSDGSLNSADGFIATQKFQLLDKGKISINSNNALGYRLFHILCYAANGTFLGYLNVSDCGLDYEITTDVILRKFPSTTYVGVNIWGGSAHAAITDADVADMVVEYILDYSNKQLGEKLDGIVQDVSEIIDEFLPISETKEYLNAIPGYIAPDGTLTSGYYHIEKSISSGDVVKCKCATGSNVRAYVIKDKNGVVTRVYGAEDWGTSHNYDVEVTINRDEDGGKIYVNSIYSGLGVKVTKDVKKLNGDNIIDKSMPIEKLKGKIYNLFNYDTITTGVIINPADGSELQSLEYRFASDFIPVVAGEKYTFPVYSNIYGEGVVNIAYYNVNKQYEGTITGTLNGVLLTITALGSYIRVSGETDSTYNRVPWLQNFNQFMVVNSETYPNRYYPYGEIITFDGELSERMNRIYNPLYGKIALFNGDSICEAAADEHRGWAYRIGQRNRMLWKNYGVSGGTITNGGWGTYVISERQYEVAPDYLILEGGTNDADRCGSIIGGTFPQAFGTFNPAGYTDTFDNDNFCGAVEYMFKNLVTQYPNTKIGFIIAPKMSHFNSETHEILDDTNEDFTKEHNNRRAYFEYLMKLCEKWGIKYLNLWDECKLNPWLHYEYGGADSLYVDGQHLTTKGYDIISTIIEEWMKTL